MNNAKTAANWYAQEGGDAAHAGIYDDGAVLYLCVTEATQQAIVEQIGASVVASERSDDGFCGAVIISSDDWQHGLDVVSGIMRLTFTDCRQKDDHTIQKFFGERVRRYSE
ncbi:hypothetical protein [Rosistilla oblonga]|uniref:hypothetical protein n=1 Tax=Rosistilla oblonga TaxID=2527990 RepID=UPI003A97F979